MIRTTFRTTLAAIAGALVAAGAMTMAGQPTTAGPAAPQEQEQEAQASLAHMVFFTLADRSAENAETLAAACHEYLAEHEGIQYFSVGKRAEEFDREVNVTDFDVALHMVFDSKEAHDTYQDHPRHQEFIDQNAELWSEARVFDSYLTNPLDLDR